MFKLWIKATDEQTLKQWEKAEVMGRRSYIFRYGLLSFGSYMFVVMSLFFYMNNEAYDLITFLVSLLGGLINGWFFGSQMWKKLKIQGKNIKCRQEINNEDDAYAKDN